MSADREILAPTPAAAGVVESSREARHALSHALLAASLAAGGLLVVRYSPLAEVIRPDRLRAAIEELGAVPAQLVFVLVTTVLVALGTPRVILATIGGAAFGWVLGSLHATLGTVLGCWITWGYARRLGRPWIASRFGRRLAAIDPIVRAHGVLAVVLVRSLPVGNCHLTNLVLGLTTVRMRDYLLGTLAGTLPVTIACTVLGSAATQAGPGPRIIVSSALFVVTAALWLFVVKRSRPAAALATAWRQAGSPARETTSRRTAVPAGNSGGEIGSQNEAPPRAAVVREQEGSVLVAGATPLRDVDLRPLPPPP